jgi:hypothetical protein
VIVSYIYTANLVCLFHGVAYNLGSILLSLHSFCALPSISFQQTAFDVLMPSRKAEKEEENQFMSGSGIQNSLKYMTIDQSFFTFCSWQDRSSCPH